MIKRLWQIYLPVYEGKYWYMNIIKFPKGFWRFLKDFFYFVKHGYPKCATWNVDWYFVELMKPVLKEYLKRNDGYPDFSVDSFEEWQAIIQKMIDYLEEMDPEKFSCEDLSQKYKMESAKSQFFELFSKHFYDLWW